MLCGADTADDADAVFVHNFARLACLLHYISQIDWSISQRMVYLTPWRDRFLYIVLSFSLGPRTADALQ